MATDTDARMFAMGCYIGEVIRRVKGGEWQGSDADPNVKVNLELRLPDGSICWPTQRAMRRLKNGASDSVVAYAQELGAIAQGGGEGPEKGTVQAAVWMTALSAFCLFVSRDSLASPTASR